MTHTTNALLFILLFVNIFLEFCSLYCTWGGGGSCIDVNIGAGVGCKSLTTLAN